MGGFRKYNPEGGFSEYLYRQDGQPVIANGITAKIVTRIDDDSFHSSLPSLSSTSVAYAKRSDLNGEIEQLRIYENRKAVIDFDWGHKHGLFNKGIVHVHVVNSNGNFHEDANSVRFMTDAEIVKYGELINKLNPKARFRP